MLDVTRFEELTAALFAYVHDGEVLCVELQGEYSSFLRFNHSKVRHLGQVEDFEFELTLYTSHPNGGFRRARRSRSLSLVASQDLLTLRFELEALRALVSELPADPWCALPEHRARSLESHLGELPTLADLPSTVLKPLQGGDWVGIYQGGPIVRAFASSNGSLHWFVSEQFELDLSLHSKADEAVKITLSDHRWNASHFKKAIQRAEEHFELLKAPRKALKPGKYRTYLEPTAVADILGLMGGSGAFSESALRQGQSPLRRLRAQGAHLSPKLFIDEDYRSVQTARYIDSGELAPPQQTLIAGGHLQGTLASARTAKEYALLAQPCLENEIPRALSLRPGVLAPAEILKELDTGIYLSRVHYLNWSDRVNGGLTGMTRFAAFWVEKGELKAPIARMRFDDTLERALGTELLALTKDAQTIPLLETYRRRHPGGVSVPGMLLRSLKFCS